MDKIQRIQQKIGKMKKDTAGYNYKYFDINQLLEKLTPLLHEEGLTLIQPLTNIEGKPAIETRIYYRGVDKELETETYQLLSFVMPLPDLTDPQKMGSAITYYRRYSLQSLFALESEDDDASSTNPKPIIKKETITEYQSKNAKDKENGVDPLDDGRTYGEHYSQDVKDEI